MTPKWKKVITASVLSVSILSIGGYIYADATTLKEVNNAANYRIYDNVDQMMADADLVVRATVTEDSQNILTTQDEFTDGYTLTKIQIEKVLKGDSALEKTVYDVAEPTYIVDNGISPGKTRISYEQYTKLKPGSKYILFIKKSGGLNWVNSLQQGKINIDNTDADEEKAAQENSDFKKLKDAVLAKLSNN